MIKITDKLSRNYIVTLADIGIVTSNKLRAYADTARYIAKEIAVDIVEDKIDRYIIDDNTADYLATQITDCLMLAAKNFFRDSERRYGQCLF